MNIISCGTCGVLLDKNKLKFPEISYDEDASESTMWNGYEWVAKVLCPVCGADIPEEEEI